VPSTTRSSPLALTVLSLLHYRPLHPYGVQQLVRRWGKDEVVNVAQRTTLYRTIERLEKDGLIRTAEVNRNHRYPERTIYEVTDLGRKTAREWMLTMLAVPKAEYPEFPAALSNLLLLDRAEMVEALSARRDALQKLTDEAARSVKSAKRVGLPRITSLETEYSLAMHRAELKWVGQLVRDLESGSLDWDDEELRAIAEHLTTAG
jgi:DNA-binding PadR family transcriptional regulator